MKKLIAILIVILALNSFIFSQETHFDFGAKTNFGATFNSFNTSEGDDLHLELLLSFLFFMTFTLMSGEVWLISFAFGASNGIRQTSQRS